MRLRSWIARAKSDVRVEKRSMSLRDVIEGQKAVMVGLSLNSRLVPFMEEETGDSHCV